MNGKTLNSTTYKSVDDSTKLTIDGVTKYIDKGDILCIIPKGKTSFTFLMKNNKTINVKTSDIKSNYEGKDKVILLAYKYLKSKSDMTALYGMISDTSITEPEFRTLFNEQQKTLKMRKTNNTIFVCSAIGVALVLNAIIVVNAVDEAIN